MLPQDLGLQVVLPPAIWEQLVADLGRVSKIISQVSHSDLLLEAYLPTESVCELLVLFFKRILETLPVAHHHRLGVSERRAAGRVARVVREDVEQLLERAVQHVMHVVLPPPVLL